MKRLPARRIHEALILAVTGALGCSEATAPQPSEASLQVRLTVLGLPTAGPTHTITISDTTGVILAALVFPYQGGDTLLTGLTAGDYRILLDSPVESCIPVTPTSWVISLRPTDDRVAELQSSCYAPPARVFVRTVRNFSGAFERFVLLPENRFVYQIWGRGWTSTLAGTYLQLLTGLVFRFDADGRWESVGVLEDGCLRIEFNDVMVLSDFENGTFCTGAVP